MSPYRPICINNPKFQNDLFCRVKIEKMTEIKSIFGKVKFEDEGYLYVFDKMSRDGQLKFWRCDQFAAKNCKSRLHTNASTGTVCT